MLGHILLNTKCHRFSSVLKLESCKDLSRKFIAKLEHKPTVRHELEVLFQIIRSKIISDTLRDRLEQSGEFGPVAILHNKNGNQLFSTLLLLTLLT